VPSAALEILVVSLFVHFHAAPSIHQPDLHEGKPGRGRRRQFEFPNAKEKVGDFLSPSGFQKHVKCTELHNTVYCSEAAS
jgi:hypothetical protein